MEACWHSAGRIAREIAAGAYSSVEIVQAYLDRIAGPGAAINAVVVVDADRALAAAKAADGARAAGKPVGPLHGVPVTIKDSFDVAGLPTTFGHPERATHRAMGDAVAVSRLRAAGAIVLGKTNIPKDLADWQSYNAVYGLTRNPWDLERSPGGSSGGASAALAAGLTALELGSDIAGSIRVPADFCGVWGHKPTYGVVPMRGHGMSPDEAEPDICVAGPLARSAADLELAFDIMAGEDEAVDGAWKLVLPQERRERLSEFRFAILADDPTFPVDRSKREALDELARQLRREGATVDEAPRLPLASFETYSLFVTLLRGATSARFTLPEYEAMARAAKLLAAADTSYGAIMQRGLLNSHRHWLEAHDRRHVLKRLWGEFFERYDALVCPITTSPAFAHMIDVPKTEQWLDIDGGKRPASDVYYWLAVPSVADLPATAIPLGMSRDGLPVGAQIVGPAFGDKRCLKLARLIEAQVRGFVPPPMFAPAT